MDNLPKIDLPKYGESDKTHWEVMKLKAEVEGGSLHPARTPGFWFSAVTALVAVSGIVVQAVSSNFSLAQAKLEAQQASLDKQKAEFDTRLVNEERAKAAADLESARLKLKSVAEESERLANAVKQLQLAQAEYESKLAALDGKRKNLEDTISELASTKGDLRNKIAQLQSVFGQYQSKQAEADVARNNQKKVISNITR